MLCCLCSKMFLSQIHEMFHCNVSIAIRVTQVEYWSELFDVIPWNLHYAEICGGEASIKTMEGRFHALWMFDWLLIIYMVSPSKTQCIRNVSCWGGWSDKLYTENFTDGSKSSPLAQRLISFTLFSWEFNEIDELNSSLGYPLQARRLTSYASQEFHRMTRRVYGTMIPDVLEIDDTQTEVSWVK